MMIIDNWWTSKGVLGEPMILHVTGEGAIYHRPFCLDDTEACPSCGVKVPDCIILGIKTGAL